MWPDGFSGTLGARELRLICPCAACVDEDTGVRTLKAEDVPADITYRRIVSVGRYAFAPHFSDGHSTGIHHFAKIRQYLQGKLADTPV